jgi:hypothetical protein
MMYTKSRRKLRVESLESRVALSTFYVSNSGDNHADGSALAPWQTLQFAADQVAAGDTVIVKSGTYTGFYLETDGTAANPIRFSAEPNTLINTRNATTPDGINLEGSDYIIIEGFRVVGMPRAGIRTVINNHVIIRNNETDLNSRWGIFSGHSYDLTIENNITSRSQIEHGIYVSNSGDRPIIRGNVVWGNRANGIHMNGDLSQGEDGIISGALVEGNIIYGNGGGGGSGINADGVQDSVFQNNLLYDNHASGISLYRIDGAQGSKNNRILNNTILMASDSRWAINIKDGSTGATVYNNILYNDHSWHGSISITADSMSQFNSDYNVVMSRFTPDDGDSVLDLTSWRSTTGQDTHSIIATPAQLFVAPGSADYHLSATSPAIDAGTSQLVPAVDLEGAARPAGSGWDIGAYESGAIIGGPNAVNDTATTIQNNAVPISVLANDINPGGASLTVTIQSQATHGIASVGSSGVVTYTPNQGFTGSDSFVYQIDDGAGGTDTASVSVQVSPLQNSVGLQTDPWDGSASVLAVYGTSVADKISVTLARGGASVIVKMNRQSRGEFPLSGFRRILVFGLAQADQITVASTISKPSELHGGDGNDSVTGGGGDDLLLGDAGNDRLGGEGGRDVIIGGTGADRLTGGRRKARGDDSDLLVDGTTSYDALDAQLAAIVAEWTDRSASYSTRVAALRAGGSGVPVLNSGSVATDSERDQLSGSPDLDWFFASTVADVISDLAAGESQN